MTAWIQSAVLALFVNSVSSVTYTPSQVVEFAKCHELQTKHFLMEGGVGTANPAPCTAPTPLQTLWASYKNLLDSADSTNAADLQQVSISYKEMTEALKPFLRELPLQTAEIQTYLLSKMAALTETLLVQAVFSLSNVNRSSYALALTLSLDLWKAAYESVTEGDLLRGVHELTEQCTMRYMLALKHQWEPFHSKMIDVVDEKPDKTIQMLPKSDGMQDLLQKAIASLTGGSCTPQAISSKQWFYALKRLNYVRKNIHKSAYHMFELEMLYRLGQSGEPTDETTTTLLQDHVRHELSDAAGGLEESLRGTEKLPVAPTQEIVDALLVVRTQFDALKATIEKTLKEHAHSTEIFENIEHSSSDIDKGIDALSLLYLFEAVASGVAPGIANMYFASRQSVFLVELVREALWLFLCQNYSGKDTSKFDYFVNAFESVHKALLEGGKEKYSGIILPHSTDHCVLTQMAYVKQDFGDLRNTMVQLFSYEDFQILQKGYVRAEASTAFLVQAMKDFKAAWVSFRSTDTMRSRDLLVAYHFSNPNAAGSKDKLNSASGPEAYHSVHRKYHPEYRAILYSRNYYDIFFFDLQGNCIYSVFKELDFATNFAATGSGPYRSSGLGEAYQAALAAPEEIHVTPWAPYDPSKGALASFICTGVRDGSELIGVFCTQMPAETRPITVAEMETALDRASKSMDLATSYKVYHPGCTSTISQTAWEQLIAKMSLVEVDSYRIQTEFQLLNAGYSQLWLNQADQGREEQKAKVAASVTTELGDAFVEFKAAWDAYRATNEERLLSLQIRYILLNPFPTGQKDKLDSAEGPETYHEVHQKYHPTYRALLYEKNYYDIFFLYVEGNCIYSVYKELDYATNFAENGGGEWKESGLGDAFRAAMKSPHQVNYIDWKPYGPSNGALASFLSVAVHRGEKMVGVFCTQLPPEIEPRNSSAYLQDFIDDLSTTFEKFRYGSLEDKIYPPPTQPMTDGFIAANDIWDQLKPLLIQEEQDMAAVRLLTEQLAEAAASLNPLLLDGAWEAYPALEGAKIQTSASLLLLLQRLTRDAVRFALNGPSAAFQGDIKSVDENLQALMNGRSGRRLVSKNDIDIVSSVEGVELLKLLETAWLLQKPKLVEFFDMTTPGEANLKSLIDAADDTRTAAEKVMQHVSTTTRTTTLIEVHVLTPVPLSGRWAAGQTFHTALRLAESLINNDQLILPGYELKHDIMDDECDGGKGADVVVSANTARDTYVALAGMGCNEVCRQVATLSASLKLPFLSFYCPTPDFSNVAVHPQLARLGTVLEPHLPQIMSELKVRHAWSHIFVISCDSSYSAEAERYVEILQNVGIRPTSLSPASDKRFEDIQNLMSGIKEQTTGEQRVVLVVGDETFFRTLICASITARLHSGLTWISFGVQRSEWWKKSDLSTSAQRQWVSETAGSFQFVKAFTELKTGWDLFRQSTEATRSVLTELYVTELKDALITVDGGESYHQAHQEWHPIYRSLLYRRKYYDIFFFDIEGNMIYSVYKEADFATNFAASSNGPWKDSGLGRVYQEAMANPDDIHYADFAPYGPSGGAEAAFFATGVRDSTDQLIGVYAIQLPPDYQKSIEDQVPECSLEAINAAYEGAVSVVGLGKPVSEDMEKPLPCFKGHSPRSFRALLDHHLQNGFPEGDLSTIVSDPYDDVKGLAVDGACAFAFSLQSMLKQGSTMGQVQHPDDEVYQRFTSFLRTSMDFQGISGRVKFDGNDRANTLAIQQVRQGRSIEVGLVDPQGLRWLDNGTVADAWKIEPVPPFEQMWLIQAALVSLAVICPCMLGLVIGIRMVRKKRALRNAPNVPNALV